MAKTIGSFDLASLKNLRDDVTQYFWFESDSSSAWGSGAHVTLYPESQFTNSTSPNYMKGQNIIMNTDGFSIRNGGLPMMVLDNDSLDFNTVDTIAGTYTNVASFGASSTIGVIDGTESYMALDYHSLQLIDKNGNTYFYASDLRGADGNATLAPIFYGDGQTTDFILDPPANDTTYTVTVSDSSGGAITKATGWVTFASAPTDRAIITVTYQTNNFRAKAYTIGIRGSGNVGALSVAEGNQTIASGSDSHAEGNQTIAEGAGSHAEGYKATASGVGSHAEGFRSTAMGNYSHAEGYMTTVNDSYAHAEGYRTTATKSVAHAEGYYTTASGYYSHAEGYYTTAQGLTSHAEGDHTTAKSLTSHAQNMHTIASMRAQTALGSYNVEDTATTTTHPSGMADYGQYAIILGNGTADNARSNALTVDWNGNVEASGNVYASNIGDWITDVPSAVSCQSGKYYKIASVTLSPGSWIMSTNGYYPATNATGYRDIFVTAEDFTNGTTTQPTNYGNITRSVIPAGNFVQYPNATFPVKVSATDYPNGRTFYLVGHHNAGTNINVTGRMYAMQLR